MIKSNAWRLGLATLSLIVSTPTWADPQWSTHTRDYEITITNLTAGQILTPALAVSHDRHFRLFEAGEPASDTLATLAETGDPQPAATQAMNDTHVFDVQTDTAPILPGQSRSLILSADRFARKFSVAGMLAATNDGFYAVNAASLPWWGATTIYAWAYDAGSEANNEQCDHIPGPPCDNGRNEHQSDRVNFVRVHNGIHGIGDLSSPALDWRGPVAKITIRRVE